MQPLTVFRVRTNFHQSCTITRSKSVKERGLFLPFLKLIIMQKLIAK